jgi:hypothetical protein
VEAEAFAVGDDVEMGVGAIRFMPPGNRNATTSAGESCETSAGESSKGWTGSALKPATNPAMPPAPQTAKHANARLPER